MTMTFAEAFVALELGAKVRVSDGRIEPTGSAKSLAAKVWRSHNFTGELVAKTDVTPRRMTFRLPRANGVVPGFEIVETANEHSFEEIVA